MRVDPGELRTELVLEEASRTPDGAGGFTESWTGIATVFARLQPIVVRDRFGADQTIEEVTHRVTIRHRPDVASGMRFVMGDRTLSILTVHDPDETGRYLVCRTREQGR
ncbi:phage head closure protein [Mesorhizobium australicum]|uniref:Phage head-tail adaptor, putative, SPP1 family n=1 Tax=Mesorhizobium australicum TaxID=536018 RepID=A0A1X7NX47_9HYPH|nr:phage head closure protein [Mesorhizobium australicum]SMH42829.1 phage head-tail adaptor, putative, SPP1 family [Mesorhizobium australicum]